MDSERLDSLGTRLRSRTLALTTGLAKLGMALALLMGLPSILIAQAQGLYSGSSVGSDGTVFGWGITYVPSPQPGMYHYNSVSGTLTSPHGRQVNGSGPYWTLGSSRYDISLPYDPNDLGTYLVQSTGDVWCSALVAYIVYHTVTQSSAPLPFVVLSLVTNGPISDDNFGKAQFSSWMGSTSLGTRYYPTDDDWATGVQIIGQVYPSWFTGSITIHREVRQGYSYTGSTLSSQDAPPIYDDTSVVTLRDDDPQSGGSAGKVYDLDPPGIHGVSIPIGVTHRTRANFRQWAVLYPQRIVVSPIDLYWYTRVSVQHDGSGWHFAGDVPGNNIAGVGATKITWNLQ